MTKITQIDPIADEVFQTLSERLEDAKNGKIDGFIMLSVYKKSGEVVTDLKGEFSPDPDDLALLSGYLHMMDKDLYRIVTTDDDEDE